MQQVALYLTGALRFGANHESDPRDEILDDLWTDVNGWRELDQSEGVPTNFSTKSFQAQIRGGAKRAFKGLFSKVSTLTQEDTDRINQEAQAKLDAEEAKKEAMALKKEGEMTTEVYEARYKANAAKWDSFLPKAKPTKAFCCKVLRGIVKHDYVQFAIDKVECTARILGDARFKPDVDFDHFYTAVQAWMMSFLVCGVIRVETAILFVTKIRDLYRDAVDGVSLEHLIDMATYAWAHVIAKMTHEPAGDWNDVIEKEVKDPWTWSYQRVIDTKAKKQAEDKEKPTPRKPNETPAGKKHTSGEAFGGYCHGCRGFGHKIQDCPNPSAKKMKTEGGKGKGKSKGKGDKGRFQGICNNCGRAGHKFADCWAPGGGACNDGGQSKGGKGKHNFGKGFNEPGWIFQNAAEMKGQWNPKGKSSKGGKGEQKGGKGGKGDGSVFPY